MAGAYDSGMERSALPGDRAAGRSSTRPALSPAEFGERFGAAARTLWCVAAAMTQDRTEAEDVLQEAAAVALGKLEQFDASTNFTAWMAAIVRLVALGRRRKSIRRKTAPTDPGALDGMASSVEEGKGRSVTSMGQLAEDQHAFEDRVVRALGRLEESRRACLLLRTVLDLPYAEIGRVLDIPEATAMSHVHRARLTLRETLGSRAGAASEPEGRSA